MFEKGPTWNNLFISNIAINKITPNGFGKLKGLINGQVHHSV